MASQGKTLFLLGGVLVAGIAAAIWFAMDNSTDTGASGDTVLAADPAAAPDAGGKSVPAGNRRARKTGTASVVGEVRRSKGKVPVADQEIQLFPEKGDPWTVKTDAHGAFQLTELPHGGPYELRVAAPKCGTIHIPGIALDRNEKRDVGTLWLDPSVRVGVQVKAWSDLPVEGAVVEAFAVVQADNFDWSKAYAQMGATPVAVTKATTDAEGKAVFPELATGRWTFTASKEGYARSGRSGVTIRSDIEPPTVKLFLGTGHPLSGRVVDAAKATVAGALVLAGPPNNAWDLGSAPLRARSTTDAQGHYAFTSLEAGDTVLMVGRPGGIPSVVATVRIPNVKQFDVTLKGTATVTGTVTDKDGAKPIEGATVRAWGVSVAEATSDAQGKFSVVVSEGAVASIVAEKDGWVSADEPGRQPPPLQLREGESQTRDLKMRPGAKISGTVKGPDGPLAGVKVWAHSGSPNGGWAQKMATTDADGHYEVGSLTPGKVLVRADFAGWYVKDFPDQWWMLMQQQGPSPFKVEVAEGGAATKDLEMVRGTAVEGRVDGPDGPLAGVRVMTPSDWEGGCVTGDTGTFRVEGVKPSAAVTLFAVKEGFAPSAANKSFAVASDKPTTDVVLKMIRVGVVKGTVTSSDGVPLKDAQVRVNSWQDRGDMGYQNYYNPNSAANAGAPVRADGSYEIPLGGQPSGKFMVTVTALDRPTATSEPQSIVEGQTDYTVNVTVDAGKDLEGKVVVKQGGAPVPGALVSLQSRGSGGARSFTRGMSMNGMGSSDGGNGQTVWAVTDADGKFAISHLTVGTYGVGATATGYVAGNTSVDLAAVNQVTVEIEPELTIEGTVKFADGSPVEGAQIGAQREAAGDPSAGNSFGGSAWTTSATGGRFRLTGLASGNFRVNVSPDWQGDVNIRSKRTDPIAAGSNDVKIVVDAGGLIVGRVMDPQKKGLAGIWVYANPEPKDGKPVEGVDSRNVRTKEDGTFAVGGLSDVTTFSLMIQANQGWDMSGGSMLKNTTLKGVLVGTKNLEIVLEEGLTIAGTIVDADGKPVANAYLQCQLTSRDGKGVSQNRNAMSDEKGSFTVGGLDPGDCQITMMEWSGPSGGLVIQNGDKIPAGSKDVQLIATKGLTITGSVADESGGAVKNAGVNAIPKSGGKNRSARVKDDGTFEITGLAAGVAYKVTAQAEGRVIGKQDDVGAGSTNVRLVLAKGLEAAGRVLDESGNPVKQGTLVLTLGSDNDYRKYTQTDGDGNFKVAGLVNDTYDATCYVRAPQSKGYRKCGVVKAGDSGVTLQIVAEK